MKTRKIQHCQAEEKQAWKKTKRPQKQGSWIKCLKETWSEHVALQKASRESFKSVRLKVGTL